MQETINIRDTIMLFDKKIDYRPFPEVLKAVQEFISKNYASILLDKPEENRELVKTYIARFLENKNIGVEGMEQEQLCELLYGEMTGFSFLTKYLYRDDVEEINLNQWKDVKITYSNGEILPAEEHFNSPGHAVDVIRRLLHKSGMIFDSAQTVVVGHLNNKIRITVMGDGVIDAEKGLAASLRIVNPRKLSKEEFIQSGTATEEMLDLLSICYNHGVSLCISGATFSGKTTLMSWILGQVPYHKRIVTIEQGCREFDLTVEGEDGSILHNVVHLVTRFSEDPKQNIDMVKFLETALTINPDCISIAEMKGNESMQAINAANTGHSMITTIHANSCSDTYSRMVTLCKQEQPGMDDDTLLDLAVKAFPIIVFAKRLEDKSRRIMEITECTRGLHGKPQLQTLYRYHIEETKYENGKPVITGEYQEIANPSDSLLKLLRENGLTMKQQEMLLREE